MCHIFLCLADRVVHQQRANEPPQPELKPAQPVTRSKTRVRQAQIKKAVDIALLDRELAIGPSLAKRQISIQRNAPYRSPVMYCDRYCGRTFAEMSRDPVWQIQLERTTADQ